MPHKQRNHRLVVARIANHNSNTYLRRRTRKKLIIKNKVNDVKRTTVSKSCVQPKNLKNLFQQLSEKFTAMWPINLLNSNHSLLKVPFIDNPMSVTPSRVVMLWEA